MIRLYPDKETERKLTLIEDDLRRCWNWMVKQIEELIEVQKIYAVKAGLVIDPGYRTKRGVPCFPPVDYDGMTPKEAQETKDENIQMYLEWNQKVHEATKKVPGCKLRLPFSKEIERFGFKYDYQFFQSHLFHHDEEVKVRAGTYQALVKNYFKSGKAADGSGRAKGQRRKKFRRKSDHMPLQTRSGMCFKTGSFGARGKNPDFYDCQVMFNGLKIKGRLPGDVPWGRVLEGVSIRRQADGWWASIKQEVPIRKLPDPIPGSVMGIDVGLVVLAAMSDGTLVRNPREKLYAEQIAGRQAKGLPVGRIQQKMTRHVRHLIYNEVLKPLERVESIKIEKLSQRIGQMGSRMTSSMRLTATIVLGRYLERVGEVDPSYTSQKCSACGHLDKEAWAFEHGPIGTCPKCGLRLHRDINAARNIANRPALTASGVDIAA